MTYISKTANIASSWCRRCTKEQEIELRNSDECRRSVEAVRNGYIEMKEQNFYRLVAGTAPDGQEEVYRNNNNLIESNKVLLDYDLTDWREKLWAQIEGHEEELGVLNAEESCRKKLHTTVRRIDGLTIEQTIEWFENRFGVKFDHTAKSLAQPCFLVPMDQVLYVDEDYYLDIVEPQHQDISDFQVDTPVVLSEEEEMEQFINELAEAQAAKLADVDFDFDTDETAAEVVEDSISTTATATDSSAPAYHPEYDNDHDEFERIVDIVVQSRIDICPEEPDWFRLAIACYFELGETDGREAYHKLSQFYPKYNYKETDDKFTHVVRSMYDQVGLGSLIFWCRNAGIFS